MKWQPRLCFRARAFFAMSEDACRMLRSSIIAIFFLFIEDSFFRKFEISPSASVRPFFVLTIPT